MNKKAWIAVGVLALLVLWLVADFKFAPAPRDPDSKPPVSEYVRASPTGVKRIEVKRKSEPFVLVRNGKNWTFEQPARYRANPKTVEEWLKGLLDATVDRAIEGKAGDLATYGLSQPATELILIQDNGETRTLQIGSDFKGSGTATAAYARELKDSRLFLLAMSQVDEVVKKKVDDLRDKRLVEVEDEKGLQKIVLERPAQAASSVELARRGEDRWEMVRPFLAPADKFDLESLTSSLKTAESESFVENSAADLAKYGLDHPQLILRVSDKNGESAIRFGKVEKEKVYAARADENVVTVVSKATFDNLNKVASELRDKKVISMERDRISYVELKNPLGNVRLQKVDGNRWQIVGNGKPQQAKADAVQRVIDSITSPATRHVAEAPTDLAQFGLAAPTITVTVNTGSSTSQVYSIGKKSPDGNYYVKGSGPSVFEAQPFVFEDANVKPEAFLDAGPK